MNTATPSHTPAVAPARGPVATVDVVLPVYNEERVLAASVLSLHRFLVELPDVAVIHLERKGRGRALRAAWSASDAEVVCYMDVDLSTDLNALEPLVAPLLAGHSDVAVGSRLLFGSHVRRQIKRELLSRGSKRLLRTVLRARFSDAQCGFKALRSDALGLLEAVRDHQWFFDTELLVLAQRRGLRIHEVPVDWIEDPDSRVRIVPTVLADLCGVARLAGAMPVVR